jgi:predicted PurR-regulated permease PerM
VKEHLPYNDITRTTLSVLAIGMLIVAAFWIAKPFLLALLWASMIVSATWPILLRLEQILWKSRNLAAVAMTILLALLVVGPLILAVSIIVANTERIVSWLESLSQFTLLPPPEWVVSLPLIGPKLAGMWRESAAAGTAGLAELMAPHAEEIVTWIFRQSGNPGKVVFDFILTVIISGVLYSTGETVAREVLRFAHRLAGERGENVVILAAKSVRGLALGVVVTAVAQSTVAGIGLAIAGVPVVFLLTAVMFVLCLAQLGPSPVLVPAAIWLFWRNETGWAVFLSIWTILVTPIDNILRPMLIRKSVDLSLFVVLPGVIGGLITLGIIGVFVGPVVLAVAFSLLEAWIHEDEPANEEEADATQTNGASTGHSDNSSDGSEACESGTDQATGGDRLCQSGDAGLGVQHGDRPPGP